MAQIFYCHILKRVIGRSTISSINQYRSLSTQDSQKPHYDVIIAGGGLVGVSLAVSLGKIRQNLAKIMKKFHHGFVQVCTVQVHYLV